MRKAAVFWAILACAACGGSAVQSAPAALPSSSPTLTVFPPGTDASALLPTVQEALQTPGKGPDFTRFLILADGDRYGSSWNEGDFQVVVGAGVRMPEGALRICRRWNQAKGAMVDGSNNQLQTMGVIIAVEPGAPRPWPTAVARSCEAFATALAHEVHLHPDCVVAMADIPYVHRHTSADEERALAADARRGVGAPAPDATLRIQGAEGMIEVPVETRNTPNGIAVGMMMRRRFDGENRGMLFVYDFPTYRFYWMRNCFIPIDLAYLRDGKVDQIHHMEPQAGADPEDFARYESRSAIRFALEMSAGWFDRHGVKTGALVEGLPR